MVHQSNDLVQLTVTGFQSMISCLHRKTKMKTPLKLVNSDFASENKRKMATMKQAGEMKAEEGKRALSVAGFVANRNELKR